jgi:hypothetical protein
VEQGERVGEEERKKRGERIEDERGLCYIKDKGVSLVGALLIDRGLTTRAPH